MSAVPTLAAGSAAEAQNLFYTTTAQFTSCGAAGTFTFANGITTGVCFFGDVAGTTANRIAVGYVPTSFEGTVPFTSSGSPPLDVPVGFLVTQAAGAGTATTNAGLVVNMHAEAFYYQFGRWVDFPITLPFGLSGTIGSTDSQLVLQLNNGGGFSSSNFVVTPAPPVSGFLVEAPNVAGHTLGTTPISVLIAVTPAPEPSTCVLLGSGLLVLASFARRRRAHAAARG
jgi:hypothetical protein